jgi:copper chaperone CopZ
MERKMVIEGMKCMHCKASVEKALKDVSGVSDAEADLETKTARIILERPVADAALMDAVRAKGFEPVQIS